MKPAVAKGLQAVGVLLLLVLAWTGINGAIEQYAGMHTALQRIQTAAQLALGISSAFALVVTFRALRWRRVAYPVFVLSATLAAALAPVAWAHSGVGQGVVAGVGALLVAALIVWLARGGAPHVPATGQTQAGV